MNTLLYFQSRPGVRHAFEASQGTWGGRNIVALVPSGERQTAVGDDGSEVFPDGKVRNTKGYYTHIDKPVPVEGHCLFVDRRGTLHEFEKATGSIKDVEIAAIYVGDDRTFLVGVDGRVFRNGFEECGPGYFTPIPDPAPPRSPDRVRDLILPRLVAAQPTFLQRPDQEEVLKRVLSEGYKHRNNYSSMSAVVRRALDWPASAPTQHPIGWFELDEAGKALKDVINGVSHFQPKEWGDDWQEITGEELEVYSFGNFLEGGYVVFRRADGTHRLEHTHGPEEAEGREENERPWSVFRVHQRDVPADVYVECDWVGEENDDRLAQGRHEDPLVRAEELVLVGDEHGWENLDSYPLPLTGQEIKLRWEGVDWDKEIAENAENTISSGRYGVEPVLGTLYEILTLCEQKGWDIDSYVAEAKQLRRQTLDAEGPEPNVGWVANDILNALNSLAKGFLADNTSVLVRVGRREVEQIVRDNETRTWKVLPFE